MPFRAAFDCLWCGRRHAVRGPADIEGYALLCPDCLGKAGSNGFLRARLHAALQERAATARAPRPANADGDPPGDPDPHPESRGDGGAGPDAPGNDRIPAGPERADA